jgi:DNA repair photolyase
MRTIPAKTILSSYTENGWFGSNYNMNIYKGCCHGCIYCDSRSECYRVENFDEVRSKEKALLTIEQDLKSKRRRGVVITGSMSDPYNPFEQNELLTRGALKLIDKYGFGAVIDTKSELVTRDIDCLLSIKSHSPAAVNFTVTCADDGLCRKIERNVCVSSRRFAAIKRLADSGIPCGVLLMPVLPFIGDTEENIRGIVQSAAESGAKWIYNGYEKCFGVTLRTNQREHFYAWLDKVFPGIKQLYISQYRDSYSCNSPNAAKLWQLFIGLCEKYGLLCRMDEISEKIKSGYSAEQMSLF